MVRLIVLAQVLSGTVKASFHRGNAGVEGLGDLGMAAPFLHEGQQRAVLRPQLPESMTQGIELLRIDRSRRLRDVLMLLAKGEKDTPQLLPPELIDAGIAREPEQPRLELCRSLQTIDGANHLDEHLLRQIFHIITSPCHSINDAGNAVLVTDDELTLGGFVALLSPPHKVGQRRR